MAAAGPDADAGEDLAVAVDEVEAARHVRGKEHLHVLAIDAAVLSAGLPRRAGVVRVLVKNAAR